MTNNELELQQMTAESGRWMMTSEDYRTTLDGRGQWVTGLSDDLADLEAWR
jgi:hypothetical protein